MFIICIAIFIVILLKFFNTKKEVGYVDFSKFKNQISKLEKKKEIQKKYFSSKKYSSSKKTFYKPKS